MADDSPEVKALKEQIACAESEHDLANALLNEWQAKKKLADSKAGTDVLSNAAQAKAQAEAQTAVFLQEKAAADAKSAAAAAELSALKARLGTVTASGISGTVTTDSGAGSGEAGLLAAQAVDAAARRIKEVLPELEAGQRYIIFAGPQRPNLGHWRGFQLQREVVAAAFHSAQRAKQQADNAAARVPMGPGAEEEGGVESVGAVLTGAGAILDLGSKLGSYFQSDYKLGQEAVAGSDDDLLAVSVAGLLQGSWFPNRWVPQGSETTLSAPRGMESGARPSGPR
ncbi:hypothetical protein [Thiocapsa bogorovii]|uniref:hypothetical protein n=1 Tax=Thiocapsa bogorovii TaxID=521689 RepID=UPI001E55772E|nr:hypothetical protein [Thiocapsa bogorovii]UHD16365.1 hypothetical protein LT988_24510 [Thiocapsa bogorovii]